MYYVLVAVDDNKELTATELCKDFEGFDGVKCAFIVRDGHQCFPEDIHVGEFYTTPTALERLVRADVLADN